MVLSVATAVPGLTRSANFPRFSDAEYQRRFQLVRAMMKQEEVGALIVHAPGPGIATIHYLSNYLQSSPAWLVFPLEGESSLFLHFYNHIPCAKEMGFVEDVQCYWPSAAQSLAQNLRSRGLGSGRVGAVGLGTSIPYTQFMTLQNLLPDVQFIDLSRPYNEIRWVRSDEELHWIRQSAYLTDLCCEMLERRIKPGLTEFDLSAIVHDAFLSNGGRMGIHFIATTSMAQPERFVPWQSLTPRVLNKGDVVITEITVSYWGYSTQIHRPFAVSAEPAPIYRKLYDVALECFETVSKILKPGTTSGEIVEAASIIEELGFPVFDSVVHGEGGKNPELGTKNSAHAFEPWTFMENNVIVIQPNPITKDHTAGLQLGAAVCVTPKGAQSLHNYPFKFPVCG